MKFSGAELLMRGLFAERHCTFVGAERHSTLENASLIFSFWVIGCFGAVATGMQLRVILMSAMTGMTALQRLLSFALLNWT